MLTPGVALQLSSFSASNSGHVAGEQMVALLVWVVGEESEGEWPNPREDFEMSLSTENSALLGG